MAHVSWRVETFDPQKTAYRHGHATLAWTPWWTPWWSASVILWDQDVQGRQSTGCGELRDREAGWPAETCRYGQKWSSFVPPSEATWECEARQRPLREDMDTGVASCTIPRLELCRSGRLRRRQRWTSWRCGPNIKRRWHSDRGQGTREAVGNQSDQISLWAIACHSQRPTSRGLHSGLRKVKAKKD